MILLHSRKVLTMAHWSYGHNVSGYVPESDVICQDGCADALAGLREDLEHERDSVEGDTGDAELDASYQALYDSLGTALAELDKATPGQPFLAYTSDGGAHRIPTAWWVDVCAEDHETESG